MQAGIYVGIHSKAKLMELLSRDIYSASDERFARQSWRIIRQRYSKTENKIFFFL